MKRRRQGLLIVAVSTLAVVTQGWPAVAAAGGGVRAAAPASALCPSSAPSSSELAAVLYTLDQRLIARSASTGMIVSIDGSRQEETFRQWRYKADPTSGRSKFYFRTIDVNDGLEGEAGSYDDVVAHRRYRLVTWAGPATRMENAALEDLGRPSVWLRMSSTRVKAWPLPGYRRFVGDFVGKLRYDIPGSTFTCTEDNAAVTMVATGSGVSRTATVHLDATGAPTSFTLTGNADEQEQFTGSFGYARPSLTAPGPSITGNTLRIAATRQMVRDLRDEYVKPAAKSPVAKAKTHSARVAALRTASKSANARFVKDYNRGTSTGITSTGKNVTNGRKYVIRCGSATGSVTFTIKGTKIVTKSVVPKLP